MKLTYTGPSRRIRADSSGEWVKQGQVIDLPEETVAVLRAAGHRFTPVDEKEDLPPANDEALDPTPPEPEADTTTAEAAKVNEAGYSWMNAKDTEQAATE